MTNEQKSALHWVLIEAIDLHHDRDLEPEDKEEERLALLSLVQLLREHGVNVDNNQFAL
jgi:hypothetical protein